MRFIVYTTTILKYCTMEFITLYSKYFLKLSISLKTMLSSPITGIITGTIVLVSSMTSVQKAIYLLMIFFILDFITGITASLIEKRKKEKENPAFKEQALISSDKLKLSAIKAFTYTSSILGVFGIEKVFFIKTFKFENVSTEDLTVTLIFIGFCCSIEFYSIVFENFKRMGFDIAKNFFKVIKGIKKILVHTES